MAEPTLPPYPYQTGFHWHALSSSVPEEERVPPFADPEISELLRISHNHTTRQARIAIRRAVQAMLHFKHSMLGTEHLLLGILSTPDQQLTSVLAKNGLDRVQVHKAFEAAFVYADVMRPPVILVTPSCKQTFRRAVEEASNQQVPVTPSHLLFSIRQEDTGMAQAFLKHWNITY